MKYYNPEVIERIGYDFYADIAERIVETRKKKGWTQEQLAKVLKWPKKKITRIELVQIRTSLEDIEALANCLDVSVNYLMQTEDDSQAGECLYLVWPEKLEDFKLYQRAMNKRHAFLKWGSMLKKAGVNPFEPRERVYVQIVGVPVTEKDIKDKFPKRTSEEDEILPNE